MKINISGFIFAAVLFLGLFEGSIGSAVALNRLLPADFHYLGALRNS